MPVWQETHGPSGDAAGFHANHCCSRPSRYRAARSGLHPSPTETTELTAKARPTRKKRRRCMAAPSVLHSRVMQVYAEIQEEATKYITQPRVVIVIGS